MGKTVSVIKRSRFIAIVLVILNTALFVYAGDEKWENLIAFSSRDAASRISTNKGQSECTYRFISNKDGNALEVKVRAGESAYPGIRIKPAGAAWNLAGYGGVESNITNLSKKTISVSMRIDNAGDWKNNPWNCERIRIPPGKTNTVKVRFGFSWGRVGYKLDPSKITAILFFTGKQKQDIAFRIDSVRASGKPGEKPDGFIRHLKPRDGLLFNFSGANARNLLKECGARVELVDCGKTPCAKITVTPDSKQKWPGVFFSAPKAVVWDLGEYMRVEFFLSNPGKSPVRVFCRVDNRGANGRDKCATADTVIAPGADATVLVPFAAGKPWNAAVKGAGSHISSADVIGTLLFFANPSEETTVLVKGIRASKSTLKPPQWLGKQPPVAGDWVVTFNDDFEGESVDQTRWNYYGPNYWDNKSHWSKDNVIVGNGVVKLRYEMKHGYHNDDRQGRQTAYSAGFLETYGKFAQLYGYFEARMKLPRAPGLWPAFWMMPDRGASAGPRWKRRDTFHGGMEFDIMEHLTRWGPNRYNIAMHWDGYKKQHKHAGTSKIYCQLDSEGFITCGLLWEPGLAVFFCNGKEVGRMAGNRISTVKSGMMFTLPQGGWDNNRVDDTKLPDDFVIDYVRVWQRKERLR